MQNAFGAELRRVEAREHLGKPAIAAILERRYDTTVEDLWDALTTPDRLSRWFAIVEGELKLGGRFQVKDNAAGSITRCDPPDALDVTWEYGGATSWVHVRLAHDGAGARLTLEHVAQRDVASAEHLAKFGPGGVGVGWDLWLLGLALHVAGAGDASAPTAVEAWTQSAEGKAFIRASGEAWGAAHAASGEDRDAACAMAERTIAFYSGE